MKISEYIYQGEFTTATITNMKRYWKLEISHNKNEVFEFNKTITNTKKKAVSIWVKVEAREVEMMKQFNK